MSRPSAPELPEPTESPWVQSRPPVAIHDDAVWLGDVRVAFSANTPAGLLTAYIDLINEMRSEPLHDTFLAREHDVQVLAEALDATPEEVLTKLKHLLRQPVEYRAWA
jgi:hypothetical protein